MSRNQKRLLVSFAISLAGALGTHIWYKSGSSISVDYGDRKPLAQLVEAVNEVQRKPLKRLIWQALSENDSLFGGEQIRTTANSEARIQIMKTGTVIALEPDSLITLEENNGELSLDFLKGNLFVKGGAADQSLKLKTGGKQIDIGGAEVSLGKGSGDAVDVQVFKGSVDGVSAAKDPFEIIGPAPQAEIHVLPDGKDSVPFEWRRKFSPQVNVVLEVGKSRTNLRAKADVKLKDGKLTTTLAPGDYYWRLVAQDPTQPGGPIVSNTYRVRIFPKRPAIPLIPEKDLAVVAPEENPTVLFKWANPGKLSDVVVEIAESQDLRKGAIRQSATSGDFLEAQIQKSGTYYWRVTGYIGQRKEPVSSTIQKFVLRVGGDLTPPVLELPTRGEKVSFQQLKEKGVYLQWKANVGAKSYKVVIKEKSPRGTASQPREESVTVPQIKLTDLEPGTYEWSVSAINSNSKESKPSEVWTFTVDQLPVLQWKDARENITFFYITEKPEVATEWLSGPRAAVNYRLNLRPEAGDDSKVSSVVVNALSARTLVDQEGRYIASVEALNKDGTVIAKTINKVIEVKAAPLLPAPVFDEAVPPQLKASRNGGIDVGWKSVEGAKGYVVEVRDSSGAIVKEESSLSTRGGVRKLRPGEFKVSVRAVDTSGRRGLASEERPLLVPETSDVKAPKMKQIKVE